jgi:hypothetical protein
MVTVVRGDVILCDLNPVVGTEQAAVTKPSHDDPILALYH